jgi:hypothetical protein
MQQYFGNHKIKGLAIGFSLSIASFIIVSFKGYEGSRNYGIVLFSIMAISIALGNFLFAKQYPKHYTFGNVFAHGFKTALVALLVFIAYNIIDDYLLHPNLKAEAVAFAKKSWDSVSIKEVDLATRQKSINAFEERYFTIKLGSLVFFFGVIGALGSLIGAVISPRKD